MVCWLGKLDDPCVSMMDPWNTSMNPPHKVERRYLVRSIYQSVDLLTHHLRPCTSPGILLCPSAADLGILASKYEH